jgi:hypothetical protein
MTCLEFWNTMPELRRPFGPGSPGAEHVRACDGCARLLEQHRTLSGALRSAQDGWRQDGAPRRVEERLTAAFRSYHGVLAGSRQPLWVPALTFAAAAAVMVVLAIFLIQGRQPEPPARRSPSGMHLANRESPERVTSEDGFIQLPHALYLEASDEVDLVRLEMPRSAMMALGISVSAERADERVQAEVKVGADGVARAVRFLEEE